MKSIFTRLFTFSLVMLALAGSANAQHYYVTVQPTHAVVVRPPMPRPGYVWMEPEWRWSGGRYVWVTGRWMPPPYHGAVWVPGRWRREPRGWYWIPGHWRRV